MSEQQVPDEVEAVITDLFNRAPFMGDKYQSWRDGFLAGMKWRDEKHNRPCAYWSNMKVDECDCREYA